MTISLKHSFTSPIADAGNPEEVGPNEWNAEHTLTQADARLLGRNEGSDGATRELTAAQAKALLAIEQGDVSGLVAALAALQPLDADLTAIAALTTTSFGRALLELANATALAALVDSFFLTPAEGNAAYQPLDSDLTAIAALTTTSFGRALLTQADASALRSTAGLVIGTNVQAYDSDLDAIAALAPSNDALIQRKAGAWTSRTVAQLLVDLAAAGTTFQPLDSDLTAIAALTTTTFGRSLLTEASAATAFATLKQAASDTATGVVELATTTEAEAGTDTARAVTPAGLKAGAPLPPGFVSVRVSQAADTDHDITFATGRCRDSTGARNLVLASAITKQIDAGWAVGNNAGGLDTGSVANNTWYYLWVIMRSDTGVVDAMFSTSATAPTMPANYDYKQRVGAVRSDGSANIIAFYQAANDLDRFNYKTRIEDADVNNQGTSRVLYALSVPPSSEAIVRLAVFEQTANPNIAMLLVCPSETDTAVTMGVGNTNANMGAFGSGYYNWGLETREFIIETNSSSQIAIRANASNIDLTLNTIGYRIMRGILP